jgi:hypothetical protein
MGNSIRFPAADSLDAEPHAPIVSVLVSIFCILVLAVVVSFLYLTDREQDEAKAIRASSVELLDE